MVTHQGLLGTSDESLARRLAKRHAERFDADFWAYTHASVMSRLVAGARVVDLGCGPGTLLLDIARRYPDFRLVGIDNSREMVAHARRWPWPDHAPDFCIGDVMAGLPLRGSSADVVILSSVLHLATDPFAVLAEVGRVLAPGGILLLVDWIRVPLKQYVQRRREIADEPSEIALAHALRLFPYHCRYTEEDWLWLLETAGFPPRSRQRLRATHMVWAVEPTAS